MGQAHAWLRLAALLGDRAGEQDRSSLVTLRVGRIHRRVPVAPGARGHAGPAAEGAISGAAWFISGDAPGNQDFVKAYRAKYNNDPDQFAAQAYAGVYLLANGFKTAGATDSKSLRDGLAKLRNVDTILGKFSFNESRDAVHTPILQVIKDGKFELFQ